MTVDPAIVAVVRVGLALVFAAAFVHKARDLRAFGATLSDYRLLPERLVPALAPALIAAEAATAALLVAPAQAAPGGAAALLLLLAYTAAIAVNLARGRRHIDCGCLGPWARQPLSGWLLVRNGALMTAAGLLFVPEAARELRWVDGLSLAFATATLALLWDAVHRLARLPRRSP